jgi:hypothetical protein
MRGALLRVLPAAITATLALIFLLAFRPLRPALVLDGYVLVLGALGLATLVRATRQAQPAGGAPAFERALRRPVPEAKRPADLAKLEREVTLARGSAFYLHVRLCPVLREIAAERLRERRGIDLAPGSEAARAALGEPLWELVRSDRPAPDDRDAPGLPLARLAEAVDALERI